MNNPTGFRNSDDPIVIAATPGGEREVAVRLARIGFDHVLGYLPDVEAFLTAHPERVQASRLTPAQLADLISESRAEEVRPVVVDVRNAGERDSGYLPGTIHIPLAELARRATELPPDRPVVVHCAGGWRSSVAASLLGRTGRDDVSDLLGGYAAWQTVNEFAGR